MAWVSCQDTGLDGVEPEDLAEAIRLTPDADQAGHHHYGPPVAAGDTGPARFLPALAEQYIESRAMATVSDLDGVYRSAGSDGFRAVIVDFHAELRRAGFGVREGLELEVLRTPLTERTWGDGNERIPAQAWSPLAGSLTLIDGGGGEEVLHAFDSEDDLDRLLLPANSPPAYLEGPVCLELDELRPGAMLVIEAPVSQRLLRQARRAGAAALISSSLYPFNIDPTGQDRHLDAIQQRTLRLPLIQATAQISPRSYQRIATAVEANPETRLRFVSEVTFNARPLETLSATIVGRELPGEAVVIAAHVNEPGACDNASGAAGMLEGALALAEGIAAGTIERPRRSIVFLFGDEFRQVEAWMDRSRRTAVAGISADMIGNSPERTGAVALLERSPDPGADDPLPPDEHTAWGQNTFRGDPPVHGLAIIARCAMADVSDLEGPWVTAENPWEGGSDHDVFLEAGIPAVLFWHFTDFAYHTSLDRISMVDAAELRRSSLAILATALAVASPEIRDQKRYLASLNHERGVRLRSAELEELPDVGESWIEWCEGNHRWFYELCHGEPYPVPSDR